jgi:hypothetical protein
MEQALYWLVGSVGMPLIQWLKGLLGWDGWKAMLLTVVVAVILALAALFTSKELVVGEITWANLLAVFSQVFTAATLAYKLLLGEKT